MTLREEIVGDAIRRVGCSVCEWIPTRPDDEDWAAIMEDRSLGHAAIYRAMKRRGYERISSKAIEAHRNDGHSTRGG